MELSMTKCMAIFTCTDSTMNTMEAMESFLMRKKFHRTLLDHLSFIYT